MRYETSYILFLYRETHFPKADSISWLKTRQQLSFASIVLSKFFPPFIVYIYFYPYNYFAVLFYTSPIISVKQVFFSLFRVLFHVITEYLFVFSFHILAFGNQILYNKTIRNLLYSIINHIADLHIFLYPNLQCIYERHYQITL